MSKVANEDELIVNLGNQWLMKNRGNEIMRKCYINTIMGFRRIYLSKALTCMKFFLYKQKKCFFIKETDTFGHIVV